MRRDGDWNKVRKKIIVSRGIKMKIAIGPLAIFFAFLDFEINFYKKSFLKKKFYFYKKCGNFNDFSCGHFKIENHHKVFLPFALNLI
jgi:hypothetical protein